MNRIRFWLIPGLIVLLLLGALFYFRGKIPEPAPREGVKTISVEVEKTKPKGFAKPPEPSPQEKAVADTKAAVAALDSGDLSGCAKITWDEELKKGCEDNINYQNILKSGDETQCKKLHDEELRTRCLNKVYISNAVDQRNLELCKKVTDEDLRKSCMDQISMMLAHSAVSADDCASITSETLRKQCEDNYYLKSSARQLDATGCDSISNEELAAQCRKTVAQNIEVREQSKRAAANATVAISSKEILTKCDNLNSIKAAMCKDAVYPQLAYDEKDLSYCNQLSTEAKITECNQVTREKINSYYLREALAAHDKTLCNNILDEELKTICQSS